MRAMKLNALLLLLALPVAAQQQQPSGRQALRAEIAEQQQRMRDAAAVFLDRTRSVEERASAARRVPAFGDPEQVAAAAAVVLDPAETPQIRTLALSRIEHAVDRHPELVTGVLRLAATPTTPLELRRAAARVVAGLSFSSFSMVRRSEELLPALRSMTSDPELDLRLTAFGILATAGDDFAQQRLLECVRSPATAPLPVRDCIRLLGLQRHGDASPLLHQLLLQPPDEATRLQVIRLLGGYAESRPALLELLRDPGRSEEVRLAVLGALYANDLAAFADAALPLVQDESAGDALRVYGIQAVRQRRGALLHIGRKDAVAAFDRAVAELARTSRSGEERVQASRSGAVREAALAYLRAAGIGR